MLPSQAALEAEAEAALGYLSQNKASCSLRAGLAQGNGAEAVLASARESQLVSRGSTHEREHSESESSADEAGRDLPLGWTSVSPEQRAAAVGWESTST